MFQPKNIEQSFASFLPPKDISPVVETASTEEKPHRITARLENTKYGFCPYCSKQMRYTTASGHKVLVCDEDRSVHPVKDDDSTTVSPNSLPSLNDLLFN